MPPEDQQQDQTDAPAIPDEKVIPLRKPITFGSIKITELALREPTAGELESAQRAVGSVGQLISLVCLQTKQPRKAIEMLSQRDMQECDAFLASFSGPPKPPNVDELLPT